ncbi:MAG: hypothetical protein CMM89_04200 [Rickettsiales bacterium]|nr:hypothetical protein [Rickettsiales bacterium]OUT44448.1 MAG: hypothetical protein CBB73_04095 [Pelagibacteraceae bacterium TMED13]|tara:strand:+ start:17726 stop:18178 length:453 start_codon:yes stop_codon:yes gene_type:complete
MDILKIFEENLSYLAIGAILVIFLLGLKNKDKKSVDLVEKEEPIERNVDIDLLKKYEEKLIVLKDLYKQELIDSNLYKKKIELIVKRVEDIFGKDFSSFPRFQQKIVMESLKKDIQSKVKVKVHSDVVGEKSIDSLIDAVDKRINRGKRI